MDSSVLFLIKSDLSRYTNDLRWLSFARFFFLNQAFKYNFWLRMANSKNSLIARFSRWRLSALRKKSGIDISWKTNIGSGLYLGHGQSIVVSPSAIIGENCNISHFCSIGSNNGKAAVIGNNVYIGPNSCIVENVLIGSNVTIGAGSVVTKDIPDNATVAGVPARVLHFNEPGRFIK